MRVTGVDTALTIQIHISSVLGVDSQTPARRFRMNRLRFFGEDIGSKIHLIYSRAIGPTKTQRHFACLRVYRKKKARRKKKE